MLPFMLIALAGAGLFTLASILDDDADTGADEKTLTRAHPMTAAVTIWRNGSGRTFA
ncbi:hypothetical protein [Thalassobius sp. MITS945101]|uniref:hypothetical protein n=1 Tax=Thalassobius sp. MITS945101 TaxID=3096994 RepID=UPI003999C38F